MTFIANDNVARSYIKEASKYKSIPKIEQILLFSEYQKTKDKRIKDKLINSNLMWVVKLANKYCRNEHYYADLINQGNIGLMLAFDRFDNTKNMSFTSFSTWFIEGAFKEFLQTQKQIHIPDNINRIIADVSKMKEKCLKENKKTNTYMLVEEYNATANSKIDEHFYSNIARMAGSMSSFDDQISKDDKNGTTLGDTLYTDCPTQQEIENKHNKYYTNSILDKLLDEREALIIKYKFGFINDEDLELSQIAERIGLTRERVGQIYTIAIKKLSTNKEIFTKLV